MQRFFISLLLSTAVLLACLYAGQHYLSWAAPSFAIEIILVLAGFTAVLFFYLHRMQTQQPSIFSVFYLVSISVKLVMSLALLGIVLWLDQSRAFGNATIFLVAYFVFTTVEVIFLLVKK